MDGNQVRVEHMLVVEGGFPRPRGDFHNISRFEELHMGLDSVGVVKPP